MHQLPNSHRYPTKILCHTPSPTLSPHNLIRALLPIPLFRPLFHKLHNLLNTGMRKTTKNWGNSYLHGHEKNSVTCVVLHLTLRKAKDGFLRESVARGISIESKMCTIPLIFPCGALKKSWNMILPNSPGETMHHKPILRPIKIMETAVRCFHDQKSF